jgi:hypothetical protein
MADAQRAVEAWMDFCPAQRSMHPYIDKGAVQLIEDEEVFSVDFRFAYPYHLYRVPTLEPLVPLDDDFHGAFRFHREVLQHMQWKSPRRRWVCKGPSDQRHLDALFEAYPDALCVWPHRPIVDIYASIITLSAAVYDTIQARPLDWSSMARPQAEGMKAGFDDLMANSLIHDPRVLHMPFREIAADPIAAVRKVYDMRGLTLGGEAEARMRAWLEDPENQVDRYGRYPYSYEALGLDRAWVKDLFKDYSAHFGLDDGD